MDGEILYGIQEDTQNGMSERVQTLARNIYQEFQRMIHKYDEDVVKDLMPNVVNILECLDLAYTTIQEHEVELELLREDNEQLVTQYEREKQLRKSTETKLLEVEDAREEEQKTFQNKIESLESIVRMLELKAKNASDHVFRLEEKETELRKDYSKLHDRYTELLKVHMDHLERTRVLLGTDRLESIGVISKPSINPGWNLNLNLSANQMTRSTGPLSFGFQSLENGSATKYFSNPVADFGIMTTPSLNQPKSLQNELNDITTMTDVEVLEEQPKVPNAASTEHKPSPKIAWEGAPTKEADVVKKFDFVTNPLVEGKSLKRKEERHGNTLYEELSFQEPSLEDANELLGSWVHPGEFASSDSETEEASSVNEKKVGDNFYGMGKEVENLIMENNELLATKNALNIVKDDLIAKVDELTSEQEILRDEIKSIQAARNRLRIKVDELESEIKHLREELESSNKTAKSDEESMPFQEDVPLSQRKRFTRVEMARVLMERNQYKERWMELQEAVRWTEMLRAQKAGQQDEGADRRQRQSVWKFFSNLFSSSGPERSPQQPMSLLRQSHTAPSLQLLPKAAPGSPRRQNNDQIGVQRSKESARNTNSSVVKAHVRRQDGRLQAYGWSLPSRQPTASSATANTAGQVKNSAPSVGVPVPIYCRPLEEQEPGMKIWCAAGIDLTGGRTADGQYRLGPSLLYNSPLQHNESGTVDGEAAAPQSLAAGLSDYDDSDLLEWKLSSLVWIISSVTGKSRITVVDANRPGDVILAFDKQGINALCVSSVAGVKANDFGLPDVSAVPAEPSDASLGDDPYSEDAVGKLRLVNCTTLQNELAKVNGQELNDPNCNDTVSVDPTYTVQHQPTSSVWSDVIKDGLSEPTDESVLTSTVQPTVWIGCQCGSIYVHSAVVNWKKSLAVVKVPDAVLTIIHIRGRVLAALANGQIAIFTRGADGNWNFGSYWLLQLAPPSLAIRCLVRVQSKVWAAFRNRVAVINPETLQVETTFEAHPRKESQIRQLCWAGDGVWISIRLDSSIRLFHASNYKHLQDVDIEPYVSKMLGTGKLGFSFVRITSMMISLKRLWMGTGNGVVISVPLTEGSAKPAKQQLLADEEKRDSLATVPEAGPGLEKFIPYCSMAQAQLSFHGHRDAVKFFVAVPGEVGIQSTNNSAADQQIPKLTLVISGGEGYVDFRQEPEDSHETASHLIVWQVAVPASSGKP